MVMLVAAVEHSSPEAPLNPSLILVQVKNLPVKGSVTTTPFISSEARPVWSTSGGSRYGGSRSHCFPAPRKRT